MDIYVYSSHVNKAAAPSPTTSSPVSTSSAPCKPTLTPPSTQQKSTSAGQVKMRLVAARVGGMTLPRARTGRRATTPCRRHMLSPGYTTRNLHSRHPAPKPNDGGSETACAPVTLLQPASLI